MSNFPQYAVECSFPAVGGRGFCGKPVGKVKRHDGTEYADSYCPEHQNVEWVDFADCGTRVRVYEEHGPADIVMILGRPAVRAYNEGGYCKTVVDLLDLIGWVKENHPEWLELRP